MRPIPLALCVLLIPAVALAAPPKPAPAQQPDQKAAQKKDTRPEIDRLFSQLARAQSPEDAKPIEDKIAAHFRASGSASVDLLMARAQSVLAADKKVAKRLLEAVTKIAPNYSEGWRARAALESVSGEDAAALISLQRAVTVNPRHFVALGELGAMLEDYGDKAGALKLYRRALALDPQMELAGRKVRELTQTVEGRDI
ncbi:MAG TPA: hypothetical protein VFQ69_09105 [Rhizomicrobium sp.]|nr:hypothetical protein [Rhizomicrobium sp.]